MAKGSLKVSSSAPSTSALAITGTVPTLKVIKRVTVPTLSQRREAESIVYFTITGPMVQSKKSIKQDGQATGQKAWLLPVIDLMDGNEKNYVVPAILKSSLEDDYMEGREVDDEDAVITEGTPTYIGKSFAVQKLPNANGKRYAQINAAEIDGADFVAQRKSSVEAENAAE